MDVKEALLKRFDEGTIYGIDRKTIENGREFYFDPSAPITFNVMMNITLQIILT